MASATGRFQFSFVHHLGNIFDGHHLAFEHRENFREGHRADLHVAECELFARNAAGEIVHQFFLTNGKALNNSAFLALERFAFKNLRNAAAQKIDAGLHVFLESVGLSASEGEETWAVGDFEIIDVAAVERFFGPRDASFSNHAGDGSAAAGTGEAANEHVVAGRGKLHAHFQRAQSAVLADEAFAQFGLRGGFKGNARQLAAPAQFGGRQLRMRGRGLDVPGSHRAGYSNIRTGRPRYFGSRVEHSVKSSRSRAAEVH